MSSILEGQIDLLASQAQSLAAYGEHAGATANMAEAVAVALALFGTLEVTTDPCQLSQLRVLKRWLEGAEALLEPIRRARVQGGHIARLDQFSPCSRTKDDRRHAQRRCRSSALSWSHEMLCSRS